MKLQNESAEITISTIEAYLRYFLLNRILLSVTFQKEHETIYIDTYTKRACMRKGRIYSSIKYTVINQISYNLRDARQMIHGFVIKSNNRTGSHYYKVV